MKARKSEKKRKHLPRQHVKSSSRLAGESAEVQRTFPFTAIVGQEEMKLALILNVIEPRIGGVLIMGHRGTGKSTAVRSLAELLPEIEIVADCPYRCDPNDTRNLCADCSIKIAAGRKFKSHFTPVRVVELPLGSTEDRLCGTIDIERALKARTKAFEPGLLARAHRGFLYIDEVNLLEDHLVDILLDAAASGRNRVERESISIDHPAQFVLVGSGNPEEGELRPQLQDRFGLQVQIATENDPGIRVEVVEKRVAFDSNPRAFFASAKSDEDRLRKQITQARQTVATIKLSKDLLKQIAHLCSDLKVDGHRGELTIARAATALAAFEGRSQVDSADIRRVAPMALRHRLRRDPLEQSTSAHQITDALERLFPPDSARRESAQGRGDKETRGQGDTVKGRRTTSHREEGSSANGDQPRRRAEETDEIAQLPKLDIALHRSEKRSAPSSTRRSKNTSGNKLHNSDRGRYQRAVSEKTSKVALDATLRAFAFRQLAQRAPNDEISVEALRYKVLARKQGPLFIFAIDTSGSMARHRIAIAKNALLNLLRKSYLNRDRIAIVGFSGGDARLLLPPSRSILRARRVLDGLTVGGGTPLSAALNCSLRLVNQVSSRRRTSAALLLFTDGGANVPLSKNDLSDRAEREQLIAKEIRKLGSDLRHAGVTTVVVATNNRFQPNGKADDLAAKLSAQIVYANNHLVSHML